MVPLVLDEASTALPPAGLTADGCPQAGQQASRRSGSRGGKCASRRARSFCGSRRDDSVVVPQVASGFGPVGYDVRVGWLCGGELTINGQIHLRARDYTPSTGIFTKRDPLDGVDGTTALANAYHYTNNDPLNHTDPSGMRPTNDAVLRTPCLGDHGGPNTTARVSGGECYSPYCPDGGLPEDAQPGGNACRPVTGDAELALHNELMEQQEQHYMSIAMGDTAVADKKGKAQSDTEIGIYAMTGLGGRAFPEEWTCATSERLHRDVYCTAPAPLITQLDPEIHGVTIGHFIFCNQKSDCAPGALTLRHELIHVDQEERYGYGFEDLFTQEIDFLKSRGVADIHHCANRYEREAYKTTGEMC